MAIQSNDEHQSNVAELAAAFAAEFGLAEIGRIAGRTLNYLPYCGAS